MREEIQKAIGAHALWKGRLKAAIDAGKSEFTVADAAVDNKCEFGKWLHSLADPDAQSKAHHEAVRRLHADFHKEVGKILSDALAGHRDQAQNAMRPGTPFSTSSANLTAEMMNWAKTAA